MPNIIFPTQQASEATEEYLGKVKTLDMDFVAQRLAALREAGDGNKMPAELLEHFKNKGGRQEKSEEDVEEKSEEELEDESEDEEEKSDSEFIKRALNEMDTLMSEKASEPCVCGEPDCPECGGEHSAKASRKVTFSDSDLTAEAVQRDVEAGNTEMAQARLAARQMRRERLAERIASSAQSEAAHSQRLAQRSAFRKNVVAEVEVAQQRVAAAKAATARTASYKSGTQMSNNEKQIIAQRLSASGEFPAEFIEASLMEMPSAQRTAEEEAGREIMASTLSEGAKSVALRQIVAKLAPESRNRALEYWTKDLPYGDKEWVKDLWSEKYD